MNLDIRRLVLEHEEEVLALRRDFHRNPELGYQEHRTAKVVEEHLAVSGVDDITRVTGTGVVGLLQSGCPGPVLMIRADMDALPVQEEAVGTCCSEVSGVMHACGHDAHMAIALVTARILGAHKEDWRGSVKFLFEPNEEAVGALAMIRAGVLSEPKVDAAMGLHVWAPLESGLIALDPGACWAGMDHFRVTVKGRGGHTANPQEAIDPIMASCQIVQAAQVLQTREIAPRNPLALMFGTINGGTADNVIPEQVDMGGTMRYLFDGRDEGEVQPRVRFKRIVEGVAHTFRAEAEVDFYLSQPALINDPQMTALARQAARETVGSEGLISGYLNMAGEDFSEFSVRVPSVFAMIGCGNPAVGAQYPHHHPKFCLDEAALKIGLEYLVRGALAFLGQA